MRRRISIRGCVRPSVRPSVRGSVSIKEKRGLGASYVGYPTLFLFSPLLASSFPSYLFLVSKSYIPTFPSKVYGEKAIEVDAPEPGAPKIEYRAWNPFRSKLAAGVLGGIDKIHMNPGQKVNGSFITRWSMLSWMSLSELPSISPFLPH